MLSTARVCSVQNNIKDLGFFETVDVKTTQGSASDRANIDVNVAEQIDR